MRILLGGPVRAIAAGLVLWFWVFSAAAAALQSDLVEPELSTRAGWVRYNEPPAAPAQEPEGISGGLNYLLYDNQHRIERDQVSRYRHVAYEIVNEAGLSDGARLSFNFDPSEQRLIIHSIRVIRAGGVQSRLEPGLFTTIRREPDLQSGIVDGNLTSFAELMDIRVGDVVSYDYTIINSGGVWPGGYATEMPMSWAVPLQRQTQRTLVPAGMNLTVRPWLGAPDPQITRDGEWTEYSWRIEPLAAAPAAANVPSGYPQRAEVSMSNMASWADVVEWARPLFPQQLPLPDAARARLAEIRETHVSPQSQITEAMRYVQDDIRYVADEVGLGSHYPRSPVEVVERGYGDCKDKALFLVVLLNELGFEADVVLASMSSGYHLPNLAPSPFAFDHAIVRVTLDGEDYWIDATRTHQGGRLPDLAVPAYGYVLPIAETSRELVRLDPPATNEPGTQSIESFDLAGMDDSGVGLSVETTYRGRNADWYRSSLASSSTSAMSQSYLDYYRSRYPGIEVRDPLQVEDDRDANVIRVLETYTLSQDAFEANGLRTEFPAYADLVVNQFNQIDAVDRTDPIGVPYPLHRRHIVRFDNAPYQMTGLPDVTVDEPFARYSARTESRMDGMTLTFELETKQHAVPAEAVGAVNALHNQIWDSADLSVNLSRTTAVEGVSSWLNTVDDEVLGLGMIALLYVLALTGAGLGLARDRRLPEGTVFYPVSLTKFILMSLATLNLYHVMWMWRNWRWIKQEDERTISPFMRAFFGIFFFAGLFNEIKAVAGDKRGLPAIVGVTLAVIYMIWLGVSRIADRIVENDPNADPMVLFWVFVFGLASTLPMLPIVAMVNRLNADNREALAFTSKILVRDVVMMVYGYTFIALVVVGSFFPV